MGMKRRGRSQQEEGTIGVREQENRGLEPGI